MEGIPGTIPLYDRAQGTKSHSEKGRRKRESSFKHKAHKLDREGTEG